MGRTPAQGKGRAAQALQIRRASGRYDPFCRRCKARPFALRRARGELEVLERNLEAARQELRVVDIVAEPGMGKSRLLHEFRFGSARPAHLVLAGNVRRTGSRRPSCPSSKWCAARSALSGGEAESDVVRKLEAGLTALGKLSPENLALILNLLGLSPPEGALAGLDGVLIGERTRALLSSLLEARSRASPTVLIIEDLHWVDSASEDLLGEIVGASDRFCALVLLNQRPEHQPKWLGRPHVSQLSLEPLPAGHLQRLVCSRLGIAELPETLARAVTERADGNALFAEEIVSYLTEGGALKVGGGKVKYDPAAVSGALPVELAEPPCSARRPPLA